MFSVRGISFLGVLGVLALATSGALAAGFTYGFDDAVQPFTDRSPSGFGPPVISTDQAATGGYSLFVAGGARASLVPDGDPTLGGKVTMKIFDQGKWWDGPDAVNGPRWGVTNAAENSCAALTIIHRSYLGSHDGYGYNKGDDTALGSWFSPWYYGYIGRGVVSMAPEANAGAVGEGKWTTWEFDFSPLADGNQWVTYYALHDDLTPATSVTAIIPGGVTEMFLYGSANNTNGLLLGGIYVDDVTWAPVPEPGTMALLGAGGLALLRRRMRRRR